jgi:hypothetical protein
MTDDLVKRYDLQQPTHHMGSAELVCDTYGDWVLYRDYKALLDLSSVSLCNLHREYDKRGDRIEELKAKLAKAVEIALEECPFGYGTREARDWWRDQRTTLAELKAEDRG